MRARTLGILYVLICVALWALIPVVAKLGQTTLDHHQFLFWSSLVSFGVLLGTTAALGKVGSIARYRLRDWVSVVLLGLLGTYVYYLLLYFGYAHARGLEVLVLQYSWPIFIVLLSAVILKERLTLRKAGAVALGFVGVAIVLTKGNVRDIRLDNYFVDGLVLAGAAGFALFSVLSKRIRLEPVGVISVYFLAATIASFFSMVLMSELAWPTMQSLLPILLNGILVNGYSYVFWIVALRKTDASFLAPLVFLTPVLSAVYLVVFFREPFVWAYGLGLVSVVAGGLLNSLPSKRPN